MKKLALIALILLLALISGAQPWKAKIKNDLSKKDKVTFFDIQNSINSYYNTGDFKKGYYYKNDKKQKAPGWKQFKRWEWYWDARVNPVTGGFPETSSSKEWEIFEAKTYISKSSSGDWKPLGPNLSDGGYAGIGRINCIAFHPNDTSTYWVGSPSGGLWKTSNDGNTWVTLTDQNTVLGVSDIAVPTDFQTSNTLYIATGDRDGGSVWTLSGGQYYDNHSIGVLKTIDGGNTWQSIGLKFNTNEIKIIGRLLIDTTDNQTLYASVDNGIYKSTNSGDSWTKVLNSGYVSDMEFKPGNSQVIYAASESEVYRSTDGGVNWTNVYSLSSIRIEIAVAPSDPEVVYLLASNSSGGLLGIYKSVNGGSSFTQTFDGTALNSNLLGYYSDGSGGSGGQGSYDLAIEVSPDNSDVVFIGGINTWMSIDGGYNWTINNMWTSYNEYNFDDAPEVHADKHVLKFRDNKALFEGNDGGIYKTNNKGTSWNDKTNGMVISQFYRIGVSQTLGSMVICGLQDNGTKLLYNNVWYDVKGGDGMECIIDPVDGDIQYGTYVDGEIERTLDGWSTYNTTYISDSIDDEDGGWWVTPYILDPNNTETIYVGYNDVWKSTDRGNNFVKISTMNSSQNLRSMAISPANSNVIYVADKTRIWKTVNGGTSWTNITSTLPVPSASITNIHVH